MSQFQTTIRQLLTRLGLSFFVVVLVGIGLQLSLEGRAATGINKQLNYQGKMTASTGTAVSNSSWNFRFRIYSASSGGSLLWTERWVSTTTQVSTVGGVFSVALGSLGQANQLADLDWNSDSLYLQVDLDADGNGSFEESFSTRKRLTSVPYAFNTDEVDGLHATSTAAVANYLVALDANATLNLYGEGVSSTYATSTWLYVGGGATTTGNLFVGGSDASIKLEVRSVSGDNVALITGNSAAGALRYAMFNDQAGITEITGANNPTLNFLDMNASDIVSISYATTSNRLVFDGADDAYQFNNSILIASTSPYLTFTETGANNAALLYGQTGDILSFANASGGYNFDNNLLVNGYASSTNLILKDGGSNTANRTDLYVSSGQLFFDGTQLTGSNGISPWSYTFGGALTPTSTNSGIYVTASSTIAANFRVDGDATTTGQISGGFNSRFGTNALHAQISSYSIGALGSIPIIKTNNSGGDPIGSAFGIYDTLFVAENNTGSRRPQITFGSKNYDTASTSSIIYNTTTDSIYIDAGNGFGIGTSTPYAGTSLAVNGLSFFDNRVSIQGNGTNSLLTLTGTTSDHYFTVDREGKFQLGAYTAGPALFNLSPNTRQEALGLDLFNIRTLTSNYTALYVDAAGQVGIGTTDPTVNLHVSSSGNTSQIISSSNDNAGLTLSADTGNTATGGDQDPVLQFNSANTFRSEIRYDESASILSLTTISDTPQLVIDTSGNVGVGTTTPQRNFTVADNETAYLQLSGINAGTGSSAIVELQGLRTSADGDVAQIDVMNYDTTATANLTPIARILFEKGAAVNTGSIALQVRPNTASSATTALFVEETGNIGIGDTSPLSLFTVGSGDKFQIDSSGNATSSGWFNIGSTDVGALGALVGNGDLYVGDDATITDSLSIGGNIIVSGTATTTFAGNIQIASGKDLQVQRIYSYSPLEVRSDLYTYGNASTTGKLVVGTTNPTGPNAAGDLFVSNNATTTGNINVGGQLFVAATAATSTIAHSLIIDTNTLVVNANDNRVGIGTVSPAVTFDIAGDSRIVGGLVVGDSGITANSTDGLLQVCSGACAAASIATAAGELYVEVDLEVDANANVGGILTVTGATTMTGSLSVDAGIVIDDDGAFPSVSGGSLIIGDGSDTGNVELEDGSICIGDGGCTPNSGDGVLTVASSLGVGTTTFAVLTGQTFGSLGLGVFDFDSNTAGLRMFGSASSNEIADIYVGSGGQLVLSTANTTDTGAYIEIDPEDDDYGLILRDGNTGSSVYANFYVTDTTVDYLNIAVSAVDTTLGLVVDSSQQVGIGIANPAQALEIVGNASSTGAIYAGTNIQVGQASAADDDFLYFDAANESLSWDDSPGEFDLTDDLNITGNATTSGTLTVGTLNPTSLNHGIYATIAGTVSSAAITASSTVTGGGIRISYGLQAISNGANAASTGVYGEARGGAVSNYGGYFIAQDAGGGSNYAIYGSASGATTANYGLYIDSGANRLGGDTQVVGALVVGTGATAAGTTDGLLQVCNGACGSAAIATAAGEAYVEADFEVDGTAYFGAQIAVGGAANASYAITVPNTAAQSGYGIANAWQTYSDSRVKFNQRELDYGLEELMKIIPKRYVHHSSEFIDGQLVLGSGSEAIGLIAQELREIIPEAVQKPDSESSGLWAISYDNLIPVIIKAVQEQQALIESILSNPNNLAPANNSASPDLIATPPANAKILDDPYYMTEDVFFGKAATFYGTIYVRGEALFEHKVVFEKDIEVKGKIYVSEDQAGSAIVKANATSTEIVFTGEYEVVPTIVASLSGSDETTFVNWKIVRKTAGGFTIILQETVNQDVKFDWIALAVKGSGAKPVITDFSQNLTAVGFDTPVELWVQVSDPDTTHEELTYTWEVSPNIGSIDGSSGLVFFTIPSGSNVQTGDQITIQVTVSDGTYSVTDSKTINVLVADESGNNVVVEPSPEEPEPIEEEGGDEPELVIIYGCTDQTATNYNDTATDDDGSCEYPEEEVVTEVEPEPEPVVIEETQEDNS